MRVPSRPLDTATRVRKDPWEPEGARQTSSIVLRGFERPCPRYRQGSEEFYLSLFFGTGVIKSGRSSGRMKDRPEGAPFFPFLRGDLLRAAMGVKR
jgi:hypothetical protein